MLVICADNNHASAVDYVDLGHVVLLRQMNEILLCSVLRKCCCNFFCDAHQVSVRNIPNISAHIFHAGFQRIVYLGIRDLSLKRLGEKCCDTECQHHTYQKPTLERLCNVLFAAVVMLVLSAAFHQKRDCKDGKHNGYTVCCNHRDRTDLHNSNSPLDIRCIRQKNQQHMQDFGSYANSQAIEPGGFPVVHHELPNACAKNTSHNSANGTGKAGIVTGIGKPTLNAAHQTSDKSRRPSEDQTGCQRCRISDIQNRAVYRNTKFRCQNGHYAKAYANNELFPVIRNFSKPTFLLGLIKSDCHQYRQQRRCDKTK